MNRSDDSRQAVEMAERRELLIGLLVLPAVAGVAGAAVAAEPAPPGVVTPPDPGLYKGRIDGFAGKTMAQRVQELIDREEYRELTATYALRVAHRVSTADLFTDDGVFTVERPGRPTTYSGGSREALTEMGAATTMRDPPLPQIHNYLIKVDGDHALAICSNELRITEDGKSMIGSGWYHDVLRRENGRWRFVRRDMHFRHYVPLQQGWATSPS